MNEPIEIAFEKETMKAVAQREQLETAPNLTWSSPRKKTSLLAAMNDDVHGLFTYLMHDTLGENEFGVDDIKILLNSDTDMGDSLQDLQSRTGAILDDDSIKAWLDFYAGFRWGNQTLIRTEYERPRWRVVLEKPRICDDCFEDTLREFTHGFYEAFGIGVRDSEEILGLALEGQAGSLGEHLFELQGRTERVVSAGVLEEWLEQFKGMPYDELILMKCDMGWFVRHIELDFASWSPST